MTNDNCMLSRQPIYTATMNVAAYELRTQGPQATIFGMFTDAGLDLVVGEHPGLVSLSPDALAEGLWKTIPKSRVTLGYFHDFPPSGVTAQLLSKLKNERYRLGLSAGLNSETMALLDNPAHIIKVDVTRYSPDELEKRIAELRKYKSKILAEKVDTFDDLEFCKALEIDLYQGNFLFRPAAQHKQVPVNRITMMRLLSKLQNPQILMPEVEKLVSQDVALSYKLLKYANSACIALPREVQSVGHAVRLIGMDTLRTWASALLLSTVEDKPRELMTTSLVRARMCELLGESLREIPKESFLSGGLFSVLDALLDCPMEQAVAELPLTPDIKDALIHGSGKIGQALRCAVAYERADWDEVQFFGLSPASIQEKYIHSLGWARQITSGLLN
jgi:EAL and modified HD-GYP domain-containing signal transduction protein